MDPTVQTVEEIPGNYMQFVHPDTLNSIINREGPVESLVDALKGIRRNSDGKIVYASKEPLMNQMGIDMAVRFLKAAMNQNIILTDLDQNEVKLLLRNLARSVKYSLRLHYKEYDLKDTSQLSNVLWIIILSIYGALKSASYALTLNRITQTYRKTETTAPPSKGFQIPGFGGT